MPFRVSGYAMDSKFACGQRAASQLTRILYQGGSLGPADLEYTYDPAGRRVGVSGTLASTQLPTAVSSAVYNTDNQLTQWGATALIYDLNGNTLNDGINTYVWDPRNRLASANSNGATFVYDPLGRRTDKNILGANTNFLYDGANPVQELNGSSVTANLLTGLGVDERFTRTDSNGASNYLTDALGSTVALTDSSGSSNVNYSYSPFGSISITGTTTNSYTFTGREIDGLGIDYNRARYYNPTIGRFLSEDSSGFLGSGPNLYAYASDSPTDFVDPLGLRDIIIVIWNRQGLSVGHAGAFETNGDSILSEFPTHHTTSDMLDPLQTWAQTLNREGRNPDAVYDVSVPDDSGFDSAAHDQRTRSTWNWLPTNKNQTNCVFAVEQALKAGGIPAPDADWPGNLGAWLKFEAGITQIINQTGGSRGWSVTALPNIPW